MRNRRCGTKVCEETAATVAAESFQRLALRFTDPVQHNYEIIRGIMLADETVAERSRITGLDRETVDEKARRFIQYGMFGYKTHHRTVKRFLERNPIPVQLPLPVTHFHQFEDAYRARFTVVRM
jgi:hypothetical protein